jgi:hypothetical protein
VLLGILARWAHAGFGALGDEYPTALGVTLFGLGVQTIFGSFFIGLLTLRSRREPDSEPVPVVAGDRSQEHVTHA